MKKNPNEAVSKNSQAFRLKQIVNKSKISLFTGAILLLILFGIMLVYSRISTEQIESIKYLDQYRLGSKNLTAAVQAYAVTGDSQYYDAYMNELNVEQNREVAWNGLQGNDIKASEWEQLEYIAGLSDGLVPLEEAAIEAVAAGDSQSAIDIVFGGEYGATVQEINTATDEVIETIQSRLSAEKSMLHGIQIFAAGCFLLAFAFLVKQLMHTIGFSYRELLQPIVSVSKQMTQLASGDLHSDFDMQQDDSEVGAMVQAIHYMKNSLAAIIGEITTVLAQMGQGNFQIALCEEYVGDYQLIQESFYSIAEEMRTAVQAIQTASNEVNTGAGQLADASENLAIASASQAGQVSDVEERINELINVIEVNKKEAQEAVKIFNLSGSALHAGNMKMEELKAAISEISKCSEQINSIIGAIEDIASETDLLSLNAAIEAARAGEAGRGFAVVAEQVKKLAEESAKAVGQTSELVETTMKAVQNGTMIADEAAANMEDVMLSSTEVGERVQRIVDKFELEEASIGEINANISEIAGIVDNNSAISQETAAISEEQKNQSEAMVDMIGRFVV